MTLALIAASMWIFADYLHYLLVAAVLALATSHGFGALVRFIRRATLPGPLKDRGPGIAAGLLTVGFLMLIFLPLLYFISVTYDQIAGMDIDQVKQTVIGMTEKVFAYLEAIPLLEEPVSRLRAEGLDRLKGAGLEAAFGGVTGLISGTGSLFGQIVWILLFYFLFNYYSEPLLDFMAKLIPMTLNHQTYLYRECAGTVAVVFYGTLFNMAAQGVAFGLLMAAVGGYNAFYLGVLTGFCSVVPIVGAALVYVPVIALELFAGNWVTALIVLAFAWVVMGFVIDNILRMVFIGFLKKRFGFDYTMNEILILLSILAGIAAFGFWGLIIGPMVIALTLAAANLFSTRAGDDTADGATPPPEAGAGPPPSPQVAGDEVIQDA
jgi:predicted PurR-regulated permease PerM